MKKSNKLLLLALSLFAALMPKQEANAQVLIPGRDAVVTLYGDAAHKTVAMVKRVGDPLGASAPFNTNWTPPAISPAITTWTSTTMGQIFGTTIDASGNVYFAATAGYGLGAFPNMAELAGPNPAAVPAGPNGFRTDALGNVGLIYMADKSNLNTVTAIVSTENSGSSAVPGTSSGIGTRKIPNSGFGIGNIANSTRFNRLFATNLEDGKIYSIVESSGATNGQIDDIFDPFAADAGTSGMAPYGERLFAVGVNTEFDGTTRVYYSVLKSVTAAGSLSEIWSVKLTAAGKFDPTDNQLEIKVPINTDLFYAGTIITDIAFSVRGEMLVAEKGNPHSASVYQYYGRHNAWSIGEDQYVSDYSSNHNSNGGVDYGFMKNGKGEMACDSLIWTSENAWGGVTWYGIQSIPHSGYIGPKSTWPAQAYIVDLDGLPTSNSGNWVSKGKFGDIVFFDSSCSASGPTDICNLLQIEAEKISSTPDECCYKITVRNNFHSGYFTGINISTGNLNIDNVSAGAGWGGITYKGAHSVRFGDTAKLWYMPADTTFELATICLSGSGKDLLKMHFIGNEPQFDTVCEKSISIEGCGAKVDTNCVGVFNQKAICVDGVVKMQFQIKNNSGFTMRALTFYNTNPNIKTVTSFFPIADLAPGATSPVYTLPLIVKNKDTAGCFFFSACDLNVFPGTSGQYPKFCCLDSIPYCITIPGCDPCEAIKIETAKNDPSKCCYTLSLSNNYLGATIKCVRFKGNSGTQFALLSGWNVQAPVSSSNITICAPGAGIGTGTYANFASFCLTGTATGVKGITLEFLDADGNILCEKYIELDDCQLVKPTCANIINDSLYCDGNKTKFSFYVQNNSAFPIAQVDLRLSDTSFKLDQYLILPNPPIAAGTTGGPYVISVDSSKSGTKAFCMYLTGHNKVYDPKDSTGATMCCTDSMGVICVPFINCDSSGSGCCNFAGLTIPNGITPNNDGINDVWVIKNANICSEISITVFNRWGNIVYKDPKYTNNWKGENQSGQLLPQGTYYVVIKLSTGNEMAMYLDLRY